jgi:hypothetical protein
VVPPARRIGGANARPGDVVLVSGTIGDHGVAVLSQRESLDFETTIVSTPPRCTAWWPLLAAVPGAVHVLRDPTRGGLATTLNEIARQSGVGMLLDEAAIPVKPQVEAACELLGLDPLYIANEGKLVAIVAAQADAVLAALRAHPLGAQAARIGEVHRRPAPLRADGHALRRPPRGRLAQRRAAAAHLLTLISTPARCGPHGGCACRRASPPAMNAPQTHASVDDLRPLVLLVDDELRSQEAMRRTLDDDFRMLDCR